MTLKATWILTGETIEGTLPELAEEFARRNWTLGYNGLNGDSWTRAFDSTGRCAGWVQAGEWARA